MLDHLLQSAALYRREKLSRTAALTTRHGAEDQILVLQKTKQRQKEDKNTIFTLE